MFFVPSSDLERKSTNSRVENTILDQNPSLILADEPTGALDSHSAKQLLDTLVMLRREYQATILMVTHDALSASYCDTILFMQDGEIKTVLDREQETKQSFFTSILEVMARLAGDDSYVS